MRVYPLSHYLPYLVILFLLVFPKGGVKISELPITWGYLLLGITSLTVIIKKDIKPHFHQCIALFCLIPFQLLSFFTIICNGIANLQMSIAFFISFFILPLFFFLVVPSSFEKKHLLFIKRGIFFIAIYGIFLFFFKFFTGKFLEIPFLTVNYHDLSLLEESKYISRLGIFKLISTYNNGNLFGACLLLLLPLYQILEKRRHRHYLVKIALLLTLSRTVWLGLFFFELLFYLYVKEKKGLWLLKFFFNISGILLCILGVSLYFNFSKHFFLDITFGNRIEQFNVLNHLGIFSPKPFAFLLEIIYLGILDRFGLLGLFTFLLGMVAPLIIYFLNRDNRSYPLVYSRAIAAGLLCYLGICFSDGSMLLIPTMAIYWFLCALLLYPEKEKWPEFAMT